MLRMLVSAILVCSRRENMDDRIVACWQWNKSKRFSMSDVSSSLRTVCDVEKRCEAMMSDEDNETRRWKDGSYYDSQMVAQLSDPGYAAAEVSIADFSRSGNIVGEMPEPSMQIFIKTLTVSYCDACMQGVPCFLLTFPLYLAIALEEDHHIHSMGNAKVAGDSHEKTEKGKVWWRLDYGFFWIFVFFDEKCESWDRNLDINDVLRDSARRWAASQDFLHSLQESNKIRKNW